MEFLGSFLVHIQSSLVGHTPFIFDSNDPLFSASQVFPSSLPCGYFLGIDTHGVDAAMHSVDILLGISHVDRMVAFIASFVSLCCSTERENND